MFFVGPHLTFCLPGVVHIILLVCSLVFAACRVKPLLVFFWQVQKLKDVAAGRSEAAAVTLLSG